MLHTGTKPPSFRWLSIAAAFALGIALSGCIESLDQFQGFSPVEPDASIADESDTAPREDISNNQARDVESDIDDRDAPTPPSTCEPPDSGATCAANEDVECGVFELVDGCDQTHTIDCGDCPADQECIQRQCITPTCDDGRQNQDETDVDCGGAQCPGCSLGQMCEVDSDCARGDCVDDSCTLTRSDQGLLALYRFQEGSGQTAHDHSELEPALDLAFAHPGETQDSVRWDTDCQCVSFHGGLLIADSPQKLYDHILGEPQGFTIEAWLESANLWTAHNPVRIAALTNATERNPQNFVFGQFSEHLSLRFRSAVSNGFDDEIFNNTASQDLQHVAVSVMDNQLHFYQNGQLLIGPVPTDSNVSDWNESFAFVLGNDFPLFDRPWYGRIHLTAIYDRALTAQEVQDHYDLGDHED